MSDEELRDYLFENDDFRLAIRGFTLTEQMIDTEIEKSLPARARIKVRSLGGFRARLELAVALAIVPPEWVKAIRELAALRDDFAHGKIEHLNRARTRRLARPVELMVEEFEDLFEREALASASRAS